MKSTKFSKGPWLVEMSSRESIYSVDNGEVKMIVSPRQDDMTIEESTANAHLIAAAPEMLEALELALPYLKVANNDNGLICNVAIDSIESVIKKARGEL